MILATVRTPDGRISGATVDGDRVYPFAGGEQLVDVLASPALAARTAEEALGGTGLPEGDVEFLAPIPVPPSLRDFIAFEGHIGNIRRARGGSVPDGWYREPPFYFGSPAGVLGPLEPVALPPGTQEFDYELEVAAVIGQPGRNLHPDAAADHIAGLVLMADWSCRDVQRREQQIPMGPAKSKDAATSFGPYLVTMDELGHRLTGGRVDLALAASVNGNALSKGNLADMYWALGEIVAYASRGTELRTGDVIGFGTCPGGCLLELNLLDPGDGPGWLRTGDVVVLEGELLGQIAATVVEGEPLVEIRPGGHAPA